ncbi:T9SS type B sorting domain-containing protein [Empedobacter sedimenti]|uniref:T9SS type B sorting domain-containing protein n=1 Tax=Empedobacter sedimenti TaxID=3042610 RepID=UPI0024A6141D|nr:T9SS type B sorting domain-containing protein [Empedobacter sedimenti]
MKKIFYLFLLMMNLTVFGQNYPTIHPLTGGFTFIGEKLDNNPQVFSVSTPTGAGCSVNFSDNYKFYSFKANFDMAFAFDLVATKPDFRFVVWKLAAGRLPTAIFENGGTIKANRSVQGSTNIKGLREGLTNICESNFTSSATGYAKAFEGGEILKNGETIVIVVYGSSNTDPFDIKINVAEERTIMRFNTNCFNIPYTYQEIYDEIRSNSGLDNITIYSDNTFSTVVNSGTTFSNATTLYAQVKDASGNLKYIYTIPLSFIPQHQFNFNSSAIQVFECTNTYVLKEIKLLNLLFPVGTNLSNYRIKTINGTLFTENGVINLNAGEVANLKIVVSYNGSCPVDSEEKIIKLIQGTPILTGTISDATCSSSYQINFDQIYSKIPFSRNDYDLIVTLNGANIGNGTMTPITSNLNYQVKVKPRNGGCISNPINFEVTKTSEATIQNASINNICLADFSQAHVSDAITEIQNGKSYILKYFQADGITQVTDLFTYIKTNKGGKIIVKALATDNGNAICDTAKELNFDLREPMFNNSNVTLQTLNSTCTDIGSGYNFSKSEIENHLKTQLGRTDLEFQGISDIHLNDNQDELISFRVKPIGEMCWSEDLKLKLQVVTKPDVQNPSKELTADCNNLITINDQVLSELFGANTINLFPIEIMHDNSTPLTFDASGKAQIKVLFKNIHDNRCVTEKTIIVNKKTSLSVVPPALNSYISSHSIVYCEGGDSYAINEIDTILKYIKDNYSLTSLKDKDQIFREFTPNKSFVDIELVDPNYCGSVTVKLYYQKNSLPAIVVPSKELICTDKLYELDFTKQANYANYNYVVEKEDGSKVAGVDVFNLIAGTYKITIEDKTSKCSVVKTLVVDNYPKPTITKIQINEKSIIVSAKGNGVLKYALFDENDNVLIPYQTSNELIIPDNFTNFKVRVSSDDCAISEPRIVTYLSLPNVVTPNGDGINDVWKPKGIGDTTESYRLIIFDRYGKQIYYKEGVNIIEWNGMHNGKPVAENTYWYVLTPINESNVLQVQYSGSILVKRKTN